jgi:hypothetical protein
LFEADSSSRRLTATNITPPRTTSVAPEPSHPPGAPPVFGSVGGVEVTTVVGNEVTDVGLTSLVGGDVVGGAVVGGEVVVLGAVVVVDVVAVVVVVTCWLQVTVTV